MVLKLYHVSHDDLEGLLKLTLLSPAPKVSDSVEVECLHFSQVLGAAAGLEKTIF